MKNNLLSIFLFTILVGTLISSCKKEENNQQPNNPTTSSIIAIDSIVQAVGGSDDYVYFYLTNLSNNILCSVNANVSFTKNNIVIDSGGGYTEIINPNQKFLVRCLVGSAAASYDCVQYNIEVYTNGCTVYLGKVIDNKTKCF